MALDTKIRLERLQAKAGGNAVTWGKFEIGREKTAFGKVFISTKDKHLSR